MATNPRQGQERVLVDLPPAGTTNRDLWHWRVSETPDREWLRFEGRSWTFAEFDLEVRRVAAGLRELGIGMGDRVLLGLRNRPEALQVQLALSALGAVSVPVLSGLPLSELQFPIEHSEAKLIAADDPIAPLLAENRAAVPTVERIIVLDGSPSAGEGIVPFEEISSASPLPHEPIDRYDDQSLDLIVYTSGSTGRPKGVMLKAGSMLACGLGYADLYQITPDDNYILTTSLAHSLGSVAATGITIVTGGRLTLVERFRPSKFWQQVEESQATVSVLFATHLNLLLEVDDGPGPGEHPFRLAITHIHHPRFSERFGVSLATIWGMSETCICSGSEPGYRGDLDPGYIGRPFVGGEMAVVDPESRERMPPGKDGELWLHHPQVMLGYLNDPEATAETLVDGWVRSGDRVYRDHSGRFFFVGRFKAMIKRSGENVSAEEVEAAILTHSDVIECCVIGVPDPIRSEEVAAVVVVEPGSELTAPELLAQCGEQLVRWKLPRYIKIQREPLAKTPNDKIARVETTESFEISESWDAQASGEE